MSEQRHCDLGEVGDGVFGVGACGEAAAAGTHCRISVDLDCVKLRFESFRWYWILNLVVKRCERKIGNAEVED